MGLQLGERERAGAVGGEGRGSVTSGKAALRYSEQSTWIFTSSFGPGHSGLGSRKMNLNISPLLLHPVSVGHSKRFPLNLKL